MDACGLVQLCGNPGSAVNACGLVQLCGDVGSAVGMDSLRPGPAMWECGVGGGEDRDGVSS